MKKLVKDAGTAFNRVVQVIYDFYLSFGTFQSHFYVKNNSYYNKT